MRPATASAKAAVELVSRAYDEAAILRIGHGYEEATGWPARRPAIASLPA